VTGEALLGKEYLDGVVGEANIDALVDMFVGHAVAVVVYDSVIVEIDTGLAPYSLSEGMVLTVRSFS